MERLNFLNDISLNVILVQLMGTLQDSNHAASIYGIWMYDMNHQEYILLVKYFFDIICSSYDGDDIYSEFEMVYYAISYVNPEAKYKF